MQGPKGLLLLKDVPWEGLLPLKDVLWELSP